MRDACQDCGKLLVDPGGPPKADVLLLAEFPGFYEIESGTPWTGPAGDILKSELRRVGIRYEKCRATNLWQHAKDTKGCDLSGHLQRTYEELAGRKAVLLMGSEVSTQFLGANISEVTGTKVNSKQFPGSVDIAVAIYNPAIALHDKLGEVRLGIERFGREVRRLRNSAPPILRRQT